MPLRLSLCLLAAALASGPSLPAASGEDFDFDRLVSSVERHYGKRRLHIPFMGVASFLSGAARPLGASGVKLAVIEDVDRAEAFAPTLPHSWRPVIRIVKEGREETAIFGRDEGKSIKLLLLTQDGGQAVVMQCRMHPSKFLEFLASRAWQH